MARMRLKNKGVTLLELMIVLVIIAILAILLFPAVLSFQEKSRRLACMENLKGLFTSTSAYLTSNDGVWPQIKWDSKDDREYTKKWYEALSPYGAGRPNFICPSVQSRLKNPNFEKEKFWRTDYISAFFDNKPWTATRWSTQPWFAERQDMHSGNLMVMANGSLIDIHEARRRSIGTQNP